MSDHALALAAAIRACGTDAETLPPSDNQAIELARQYTSGKECHPFIVTTGDFLKKIASPGFNPDQSAFFMPKASGPCRFGNYYQTHRLILDKLGYADIPLVSPDAKDSYSQSMGITLRFRRLAWQGIVAVDLLTKMSFESRPYEKNKGEIDSLHSFYLKQICRAVENGQGRIFSVMKDIQAAYASIPLHTKNGRPIIGLVGEIFLRQNHACNADIGRRIEALGGEAWFAPISEWFYYTNCGFMYESIMRGMPKNFLIALLRDLVQKFDEHRLSHPFKGKLRNFKEPSTIRLLQYASPYLHYSYKGEAALSLGKAIDFMLKGACGIINIMPFTCMPGTVVAALAKELKKDSDCPWFDLAIDGHEGINLDTRLEAFMHQAKSFASARN